MKRKRKSPAEKRAYQSGYATGYRTGAQRLAEVKGTLELVRRERAAWRHKVLKDVPDEHLDAIQAEIIAIGLDLLKNQ